MGSPGISKADCRIAVRSVTVPSKCGVSTTSWSTAETVTTDRGFREVFPAVARQRYFEHRPRYQAA